jgi:hypothetical protein
MTFRLELASDLFDQRAIGGELERSLDSSGHIPRRP